MPDSCSQVDVWLSFLLMTTNLMVLFCVRLQVQLYFMILERLGKCEEALSVIRGPLGGITTVYTLYWNFLLK